MLGEFDSINRWQKKWFDKTQFNNKKVLLRERKRHTARRVAIASPCYSGGGGGPLTKIFFPSQNMYQAKSGVKKFSLYWGGGGGCPSTKFFPFTGGGGVPRQKIFFPVWTCIKPNLVSKLFPFTETGYPPSRSETGYPPDLRLGTPWTWDPPYLDLGYPLPGPGTPPPNLRPGIPPKPETGYPPKSETGCPPPKC